MIFADKNSMTELLQLPLGARVTKPRHSGMTMVIDTGMGYNELEDLLETASAYIDYLKFGFGTTLLYTPTLLARKLQLAKLYGVKTCVGGTLSEIAMVQSRFEPFAIHATELGFAAIEISDGTIYLDLLERREAILKTSSFTTVISEIGKKLSDFPAPEVIVEQIENDLDAGASHVIIEGRESGEGVGIYGDGGQISEDILNEIVKRLSPTSLSKVMWEAPKKAQQIELLKRFGKDVNLGNIKPTDILSVESLRLGLRGDTFAWSLKDSETK